MAELTGQQIQFIGSKTYATAIQQTNGDIYFTTDENGSIVVNGKVYGTVDSNLMSTPTTGSLKDYIDDAANSASGSALQDAKDYTDSAIEALDVTDTAVAGKYVSAVSEANGKITVTREDLPTLSGGATGTDVKPVKSVTVSGHTITVTTVAEDLATKANLDRTNSNLTNHINDDVKHITAYERASWNDAASSINAFLKDSYMGGQAIDTLIEIQEFLKDDTTGTQALTQTVNKSAKTVTLSDTETTGWSVASDKSYVEATQTVTTTANDGSTTTDSAHIRIATTGINKYGVVALKQDGGLETDANGYVFVNPEYKMTYSMWADNATNAKHAETADNATNATNATHAESADHAEGAANVIANKGLIYNEEENDTSYIANGSVGQILMMTGSEPVWGSNLDSRIKYNNKTIATEDYVVNHVSYEIAKVNQSTGSLSSYVEALSSEVQSISDDVDQIKTYLVWQ